LKYVSFANFARRSREGTTTHESARGRCTIEICCRRRPSYRRARSHGLSRNEKMDSIATFEKNFAKFGSTAKWGLGPGLPTSTFRSFDAHVKYWRVIGEGGASPEMEAAKPRRGGSPSHEMERSGAAGGGSGAGPSPPPPTRNGPVFTVTGRVISAQRAVPQTFGPLLTFAWLHSSDDQPAWKILTRTAFANKRRSPSPWDHGGYGEAQGPCCGQANGAALANHQPRQKGCGEGIGWVIATTHR
jgi:hypothetical protein